MTTFKTLSIEQLAEKINGKLWIKDDKKRIYLDRGYNTKKMSTKTYVYQREDGSFSVSCYIDCPSQAYQWIQSQQQEVIDGVMNEIEAAFSETVYIMTNNDGQTVNYKGETVALNYSQNFLIEEKAKREVGNCAAYQSYISMPRAEFEAEVNRLDKIESEQRKKNAEIKTSSEPIKETPAALPIHNTEMATYAIGDTVKHARFGLGTILSDDGKIVEIKFNEGKKILIKTYAKLENI